MVQFLHHINHLGMMYLLGKENIDYFCLEGGEGYFLRGGSKIPGNSNICPSVTLNAWHIEQRLEQTTWVVNERMHNPCGQPAGYLSTKKK